MEKLLTRNDAASILQVSIIFLDREIKRGRLKCKRLGKCVRITYKDLEAYINRPR